MLHYCFQNVGWNDETKRRNMSRLRFRLPFVSLAWHSIRRQLDITIIDSVDYTSVSGIYDSSTFRRRRRRGRHMYRDSVLNFGRFRSLRLAFFSLSLSLSISVLGFSLSFLLSLLVKLPRHIHLVFKVDRCGSQ